MGLAMWVNPEHMASFYRRSLFLIIFLCTKIEQMFILLYNLSSSSSRYCFLLRAFEIQDFNFLACIHKHLHTLEPTMKMCLLYVRSLLRVFWWLLPSLCIHYNSLITWSWSPSVRAQMHSRISSGFSNYSLTSFVF